jgi:phosphatidylglycerophosphatase A
MALITTFGLGYRRPASGTWGSLPPCVIAGVACIVPGGERFLPGGADAPVFYIAMALIVLIFSFACISRGDEAEMYLGKKDPGEVVADETAGMALTLCALPWFHTGVPMLAWIALAFVFFRAMDIIKLWPAYGLQSAGGGWGILLDDLVAGLYAAAMVVAIALPMMG